MPTVFTRLFPVTADAIDELGHVNNLQYVAWMQEVAIGHSAANGWPMERFRQSGEAWVAHRHTITYRRPAFRGDEIVGLTWVAWMKQSSCCRRYVFRRVADGQVLVEAETVWAYTDLATGQPRRAPAVMREDFPAVADQGEALRLVGS